MLGKLFSGGSTATSVAIPLAFRMPEERALRLSSAYEPLQAWRFLSHHIRRYPLDLRAHVQRILLAGSEHLHDRLEGSLMDLHLALGNGVGGMLKERMLAQSAPHLSEEAHQFFLEWQQNGPQGGMEKEWRLGSVLATGETNVHHPLITVERPVENSRYASVLEEVQACLEYGQIDIAQELLEQEVLSGRADGDIEQELLNIYQYTRNKDKLAELAAEMSAAGREPSDVWKGYQREAENW